MRAPDESSATPRTGDNSLSREGEGWGEGDEKLLYRIAAVDMRSQRSRINLIALTLSLTGEGVESGHALSRETPLGWSLSGLNPLTPTLSLRERES